MQKIPFPKTKLEDYIEYCKEIITQTKLAAVRAKSDKNSKTQHTTLSKKIDEIYTIYKDKLYSEDIYIFKGISNLEDFLKNTLELKDYKVKEIIRHEKKHVEKASNLGYKVEGFGCMLLKTPKNKINYAVFTRINNDKIIPLEDITIMASAPSQLSYIDKLYI